MDTCAEPTFTEICTPTKIVAGPDRIRIFSNLYEVTNLSLGVLFLGVTLFCIMNYNICRYLGGRPDSQSIIVNVFLFNITHNVFNFSLPLVAPQLRSWWRQRKIFGHGAIQVSIFVYLIWFIVTLGLAYSFYVEPSNRWRDAIWNLSFVYMAYRHTFGQFYGLSRIYDRNSAALHGPPNERTQKIRAVQALWLNNVLWVHVLKMFFRIANLGSWIGPTCIIEASITIILISTTLAETNGFSSNKWIYWLRLLPISMTAIFPWCFWATLVLHGLESLFLAHSMIEKSNQITKPPNKRLWLAFFVALFVTGVLSLTRSFELGPNLTGRYPQYLIWILLFSAISESLTYTHYFIERYMFAFSEATTRKFVMPLTKI